MLRVQLGDFVGMDRLVTVVGGSGFIGRYVVQELAKQGVRLRVVVRDAHRALFLKPLGGLGQIQIVAGDLRDRAALDAAMRGADGAINLVGILAEGGGATFEAVQARGAANVAQAAAAAGVEALVHVSAIGADPDAKSRYARTKGEGEAAVRAAFPKATIIRPSIVFGPEDQFINRFAALSRGLPLLPVVAGDTRFQPVYVVDVARAIAAAITDPARFGGRTFELGGPKTYKFRDLIAWIQQQTLTNKPMIDLPDGVASFIAQLGSFVPGAPLTYDQYLMLQRDTVVADGAEGLGAFGVTPTPLEAIAPTYLVRYRKHGRFNRGDQTSKAS